MSKLTPAADPHAVHPREFDHDPVNHPSHYRSHPSGVECITITEHMSFLRGNAMKYMWRAGEKGGREQEIEDLKKARWYLNREIENLEKEWVKREVEKLTEAPNQHPLPPVTPVPESQRYGMGGMLRAGMVGAGAAGIGGPAFWDGYPPDQHLSKLWWLFNTHSGSMHQMTWLPALNMWQEGYGLDSRRITPAVVGLGYVLEGELL